MTPEEFKLKIAELGALMTEKLVELEEDKDWGTADEREELVQALDDLVIQTQAMSELLQEGD
jgi:hypothetical protein